MKQNKFMCRVLMALILAFVPSVLCAANPFPSLENEKEVEVVYVSKALMGSMSNRLPLGSIGRFTGGADLKSIDSIYVITSDKVKGIKACKDAFEVFKKQNAELELLMSSKDDEEITSLYGVPSDDGETYKALVLYVYDVDEVTLVYISGKISLAQQSEN